MNGHILKMNFSIETGVRAANCS